MDKFIRKRRLWLVPVALWTAIVAASFAWNWHIAQHDTEQLALSRAEFVMKMVESVRLWNARHGGVYAEITETTRPNDYLEVDEREIESLSGRHFTLINPAYMTRQVAAVALELSGIRMRLTSLKPINPGNEPEPWERQALRDFEAGVANRSGFVRREGEPVYRYIAPLRVKQECMRCHEKQGYRVGDVRGGVSIALPAQPLLAAMDTFRSETAVVHFLVWVSLTGLTVAALAGIRRQMLSLERAQEHLKLVDIAVQSAGEAMFWVSGDLRIRRVNAAASRLLGYSEQALCRMKMAEVTPGFEAPTSADGAFNRETIQRRSDGSLFPVELTVSPFRFSDSDYFCITCRDITERTLASEGMRAQLHAEQVIFGIASRFAGRGDLGEAVHAALADLGQAMKAQCASIVRGVNGDLPSREYTWCADQARFAACVATAPGAVELQRYRERLERGEVAREPVHSVRALSWVWVPLFEANRLSGMVELTGVRFAGVFGEAGFTLLKTASSVIGAGLERQGTDRELHQLLEENRRLARRSMTVQEQERAGLARELHDEFGQCLTAIKADAQSVCARAGENEPALQASGQAIARVSDHLYGVIRSLMRRLRPELLDALGLARALEQLVDEWRRRHPRLEWALRLDELPDRFDDDLQITVFRVVQEALTNIAKHARAERVTISLAYRRHAAEGGTGILLRICDDGRGMNPRAARTHSGYGLAGMRERVLALCGGFTLNTAPGHGCCIQAFFPTGEFRKTAALPSGSEVAASQP